MGLKKDKMDNIIQKEVSEIIQFELKNPKIGFVTITDVDVTSDMSYAKIFVSFLGRCPQRSWFEGIKSIKGVYPQRISQKADDPQNTGIDFSA